MCGLEGWWYKLVTQHTKEKIEMKKQQKRDPAHKARVTQVPMLNPTRWSCVTHAFAQHQMQWTFKKNLK